jgi:hypothetical protein
LCTFIENGRETKIKTVTRHKNVTGNERVIEVNNVSGKAVAGI